MGLFSRKKQREPASPSPSPSPQPPSAHQYGHQPHSGPPDPARSTSAPAAVTLASAGHLSSSLASSYGRSSTSHDRDPYSPDLASSDRLGVFRGSAGRGAASSTLSLPSFGGRDAAPPRQRQASATVMSSVDEHEHPVAQDKAKWWKRRGNKARQASVSSTADGAGLGIDAGGDSGFVVRSFRTVSRVHEDPVPQPLPPPVPSYVPPLTYAPKPVEARQDEPAPQPQESLRNSLDFNNNNNNNGSRPPSSYRYPRRPSLATVGGGPPSSSSNAWERAPSPTMTAEAFRFRSKSTLSLASVTDLASTNDEPQQRPRFEPQRPASRTSRRGSSYSDVGGGSILAPPRPSFAVGQHSNSSNSSINSRASSSASLGAAQGPNGLPSPPGGSPVDVRREPEVDAGRPATMTKSTSGYSVSSYTTAQQTQSGASAPGPSSSTRVASPATSPTATSRPLERPAPKRISTDDSELRLIAAYGDMLNSSPPAVDSPLEFDPADRAGLPYATPRKVSDGPGPSSRFSRTSTAPAVAVQPPTPQSAPGFASSSTSTSTSPASRRASMVPRPQRTSSLFNESAQAALAAIGVGAAPSAARTSTAAAAAKSSQRAKGKNTVYPSRGGVGGWASDSSDEERLSTSDEEDDRDGSSDDEVPLAHIRSRSQTDLSLPPSMQGQTPRASFDTGAARSARGAAPDTRGLHRRQSSELEILSEAHSPTASSFGKAQSQQSQLGVGAGRGPLARKGSNRRSLSTLSFSTSMTASQAATAAAAASESGSGPVAVSTAPSSPAVGAAAMRGILRPPYGTRSVSNPASPTVPAFPTQAAPPLPLTASTPARSPAPSPLFSSAAARDRSSASASASSGSASTSSVPITPKDSPSASNLGFVTTSQQQQQQPGTAAPSVVNVKPSVKFDPVASQTDAAGWNRGRRLSAITSSSASAFGAPGAGAAQQPSLAHRATPSMPHLGGAGSQYAASGLGGGPQRVPPPARAPASQLRAGPASHAAPSIAPAAAPAAPPHTRASSTASVSNVASTASSSTAVDDSVYDRMKARHKAEALDALRIGRDLNHPSGQVPDREGAAAGGESDEDEPLANLPTKGSVLGGAGGGGAGSMMGGVHPQMTMGMGGAFSPLAVAPPGVDPYLCASVF